MFNYNKIYLNFIIFESNRAHLLGGAFVIYDNNNISLK
jgi:hypothetical protein